MSKLPRRLGATMRARMAVGTLLLPAVFALALFGSAETWWWARAWVVVGLVFVANVASMRVLRREDPVLLARRLESPMQYGQTLADKVLMLGLTIAIVFELMFIAEDVLRSRFFAPLPLGVSGLGLATFAAGWWLVIRALAANPFALPVVKPQRDRGQRVIDRGPYALVRHPMYAGDVLVLLGMPLWLGSSAGVLAALVPIAFLMLRIVFEERFLRAELAGYDDYAARVPSRLIPGVW